jgi:NDP-sugar pyrophosphorylase family protein
MVPVLDVPLIDLALARNASVEWAARFVNVSHGAPVLREHLRERSDVTLLDEGEEPLGTAATLRCLLPQLTETVVTCNCDLVSDLDMPKLLQRHAETGEPATLAVQAVEQGADLTIEGERLRFVDRREEDRPGFVFLGAACFDRELLTRIPSTTPLGLTAGLLERALEKKQVALIEHRGYARDAGTLESYLRVSLDALDPAKLVFDTPGTMSPDGWYLGPGADADEASLDRGAIVLAGARVEGGTTLSECVVWPGSVVPAGLDLKRGIWFDDQFLTTKI